MKIVHRAFIYESIEPSDGVLNWFGDSKVVDSNGKPLQVYHGTTHSFSSFKKSNNPNFITGGIYFTSSPSDAEKNYASGTGGDSKARIEALMNSYKKISIKKIESLLGEKLSEVPRKSWSGHYFSYADDIKLRELATKTVLGDNPAPNIMPVYLKIVNPFYLDIDTMSFKIENRPNTPHNTIGIVNDDSVGYKLLAALASECNKLKIDWRDMVLDLSRNGSFTSYELYSTIIRNSSLKDIVDSKPVIVRILKYAGFDGVIMNPGMYFFGNYKDVTHYIVFNPNQIKSVFNRNPSKLVDITRE